MPNLFQPKEKKEKKEKKKSSKSIEKNEKLKKVTEKLADNPEVVKMIQEENEESNNKKSKKSGKKLPLKIIIPAVLVIFLIGGGAFFVLKTGLFFGGDASAEDNSVDKAAIYIQAETVYSEGHYYDASALYSFLGDYEDSSEMLGKIDLNNKYPDNGTRIVEYVGSDVINNYILSYKNHTEISTELENATKTTEEPASETESESKSESKESSLTTEESTQPTKKAAPNTSKELVASNTSEEAAPAAEEKSTHGEEAAPATTEETTHGETSEKTEEKTEEKAEEKIEYDEAVIEAVKEKTHQLLLAGNLVKSLNLPSDSPLYEAHETLKRSADYSSQAAEKILEGVEAGTYKPGGTGESVEEINTLLENMKREDELFHNQVSDVIALNIFLIVKCPDAGEQLDRYSESFIVFE